jgi:O-antigen ligase
MSLHNIQKFIFQNHLGIYITIHFGTWAEYSWNIIIIIIIIIIEWLEHYAKRWKVSGSRPQ